jgi:mRNA interferase MazF
VAAVVVARGDVWWGEAPDEKGRPFLIVSRDIANEVMQRVLVAPVSTRIRDLPSELRLGPEEGLPVECAASFDNLRPFPKTMLVRRLGGLGARSHEICTTAGAALDC